MQQDGGRCRTGWDGSGPESFSNDDLASIVISRTEKKTTNKGVHERIGAIKVELQICRNLQKLSFELQLQM